MHYMHDCSGVTRESVIQSVGIYIRWYTNRVSNGSKVVYAQKKCRRNRGTHNKTVQKKHLPTVLSCVVYNLYAIRKAIQIKPCFPERLIAVYLGQLSATPSSASCSCLKDTGFLSLLLSIVST